MTVPLPQREYDRTVNSEIERLLYQDRVIQMDAQGLAAGLDDQEFNWSPGAARWSVGQCIEHLNTTHRIWQPLLAEAVNSARDRNQLSDGPYAYGFLSRLFLRWTEPPVKFRARAPKRFRPAERILPGQALSEFREHHDRLDKLLADANGVDLAGVRVASAFSRYFRYSLGMAFWILLAHDRRHLWQARQIRQAAGFPARLTAAAEPQE